jgi:hypothetical protein
MHGLGSSYISGQKSDRVPKRNGGKGESFDIYPERLDSVRSNKFSSVTRQTIAEQRDGHLPQKSPCQFTGVVTQSEPTRVHVFDGRCCVNVQ